MKPAKDSGICSACGGLGTTPFFDPKMIVPEEHLSLREGAIEPWQRKFDRQYYAQALDSLARHFHISVDTPWRDLDEKVRRAILYGTRDEPVAFRFDDGDKSYSARKPFEGIVPQIERRLRETESVDERNELLRYQRALPCKTCQGREIKADTGVTSVGKKRLYGAALQAHQEKLARGGKKPVHTRKVVDTHHEKLARNRRKIQEAREARIIWLFMSLVSGFCCFVFGPWLDWNVPFIVSLLVLFLSILLFLFCLLKGVSLDDQSEESLLDVLFAGGAAVYFISVVGEIAAREVKHWWDKS